MSDLNNSEKKTEREKKKEEREQKKEECWCCWCSTTPYAGAAGARVGQYKIRQNI